MVMNAAKLLSVVTPPHGESHLLSKWIEQQELFEILRSQRFGSTLILFGSAFGKGSIFMHSVLVPQTCIAPPDIDDLLKWSGNPFDSWICGLVIGGGETPHARVELGVDPTLVSPAAKSITTEPIGRSCRDQTDHTGSRAPKLAGSAPRSRGV